VVEHFLLRTVARSGSWTAGLLLAAWAVPNVSLSSSGVIVALAFFTATQTFLSVWILKLPHGYASLLLGCTGLAVTVVALGLASSVADGVSISGVASWLAATTVVWLMTTIGAICSFDMYLPSASMSRS
jgi:hypothetical protein